MLQIFITKSYNNFQKKQKSYMKKIIIAEDDSDLRNNLFHFLEGENYKVILSDNDLNAYDLTLRENPDIIISDMDMQLNYSIQFLTKIKANPKTNSIPIILMTSESKNFDASELYPGADGYLSKPFCLNVLLQTLQNLLNASGIADHHLSDS